MLIGPFFDPILSIVVLGIEHKREERVLRAVMSLLLMIVIGIFTGVVQYLILNYFTDFIPLEVLPLGFIESFIVAVLLGAVGMFLWVWPNASNTSAGISIAISLVPPLVNISIGLVYCDLVSISYYSSMFLINILGIIFGSYVVLQFLIRKNGK
jgi:hypothetical protein